MYAQIAGAALKAIGSTSQAAGQIIQGQQTANAISYNIAIQSSNNRINQAAFQFNIDRQVDAGQSFLATQRNIIAKSGIKLDGSAVEVMINSAKEIQLDTFQLTQAKEIAQYENEVAEADARITAKYAKRNAGVAAMGTIINAGTTAGADYASSASRS